MATEWSSLIPESVARDVIAAAKDESAVLGLGNVIVMPSGATHVPVVSVAPSAVFGGVGARKPTSTIEWTAETLQPEEIALTLYIPDAYLDDAGFPVWESVRSEVAKAIGKTLDAAVLYGVGAPTSYPTGGIAALAGAAQSGSSRTPASASCRCSRPSSASSSRCSSSGSERRRGRDDVDPRSLDDARAPSRRHGAQSTQRRGARRRGRPPSVPGSAR